MGIEEFQDKVFNSDVLELIRRLPDRSVDMVWNEADYNVGYTYGTDRTKNYTRPWDEYINWYIELARESMRVLKDDGNFFALNYDRQNANLRVKYLDEACYEVLSYAWVYNSAMGHTPNHFTMAHRSILHGRKTKNSKFYKDNVAYVSMTKQGGKHTMAMPLSWIYADVVVGSSREKTFHSCQIPMRLIRLFIEAATMPGDTVLIHFAGSGGEVETCHHLQRHFITADLDPDYVAMVRERVKLGYLPEKFKQKHHQKKGFDFNGGQRSGDPATSHPPQNADPHQFSYPDPATLSSFCVNCHQPLPEKTVSGLCDTCGKEDTVKTYRKLKV